MNQLPEFWRTEVWHPLSIHFPIALLLTGLLFKVLALITKGLTWNRAGSALLLLGTLGAWIAICTGNLADGIVSRQICDPTVLKDHENAAFTVSWLFTAASLLDVTTLVGSLKINKKVLKLAVLTLMLIGSGFLIYAGHLGATLVYQQGAGVYNPSGDCNEFNEQ